MSSLTSARALGGVGAILVLLAFIPSAGALFGIVGFILILIAVSYVADVVQNPKIFKDMITAVVLAIIGLAIASVIVTATLFSAFQNGYFGTGYPLTPSADVTTAQWVAFGLSIGLGLFAAWILFLLSATYLRRSYNAMGSALEIKTFETAGLIYFIGAATAIVGVGFIILLVAQILAAVAFFSIPDRRPEKRPAAPTPAPPT